MFFSVLSKAVGLRMFSIAGGAPTSTKRPRKPPDFATNFVFSGSTKIPRKTHENRPRVRRCFERNDSEPRKSHENSTKSPRKLHERATNSKNSGSLARPWTVVQDFRILTNSGHQTCERGAKNTRPHDENPVRLAVQTRPQSNQLVKRAVFTRDFFTCSAGCPLWADLVQVQEACR